MHDRACGICGRAVVQPTAVEVDQAFARLVRSECPDPVECWVGGHLFQRTAVGDPVRIRVRCYLHAESPRG